MADFSVDRVHSGTLVADTVDVVTLGRNYRKVEVLNRDGAAEIFVRIGALSPTVAGPESECIPAAISALRLESNERGDTVVRLISSGTPTYTVTGLEE